MFFLHADRDWRQEQIEARILDGHGQAEPQIQSNYIVLQCVITLELVDRSLWFLCVDVDLK